MSDERAKGIVTEVAEGGHGSLRNALSENLQKLRIGELTDVGARNNVGSALTALSVEAVASGAIGREGSAGIFQICIAPLLRRTGGLLVLIQGHLAVNQQDSKRGDECFEQNP